MTNLELRALLGNQQAQEECTRKGIVLPCMCCGGKSELRHSSISTDFSEIIDTFFVICKKCGCKPFEFSDMNLFFTKKGVEKAEQLKIKAISAWNNRPAPPIGRCRECAYKEKATVNAKGYLICPASGMEITDTDFCSYFKSKGGDKNA